MYKIKSYAYDTKGNVLICDECNEPAGIIVQGMSANRKWCKSHFPLYKDLPASRFIYRPPVNCIDCGKPVSNTNGDTKMMHIGCDK